MLPYNRKIWGVEASEMDIDWLHKIPRLDVRQIARACLTRTADRSQMPSHSGFYYPKAGGFQRIFDAIAEPVKNGIITRCPVTSLEKVGDTLVVNGQYLARAVINTAPWHALGDSPIFDADTRKAIEALRHNQLVVSLHPGALYYRCALALSALGGAAPPPLVFYQQFRSAQRSPRAVSGDQPQALESRSRRSLRRDQHPRLSHPDPRLGIGD